MLGEVMALLADGTITPLSGQIRPPLAPRAPLGACCRGCGRQIACNVGPPPPPPPPPSPPAAGLGCVWLPGVASNPPLRAPPQPHTLPFPLHPPSPPGERYPLERAAEAVAKSMSAARGGKVLLEG